MVEAKISRDSVSGQVRLELQWYEKLAEHAVNETIADEIRKAINEDVELRAKVLEAFKVQMDKFGQELVFRGIASFVHDKTEEVEVA